MVRDNPPSHRSIRAKKEGALPGKRKNCPTLQPTEETEIDNNDVLKVLKTIRSNTTFIGVFALVIMITTIAQCAKGQELKFELSHSGFWTIRTGVDEFEDNDLRHMELSLTVRTGGRTEYDSYEMDNDKSLFVVCHNNELHLQLGIHRESPYNYMTRDVWGYSRKTPLTVLIKLDEERLPDHVIHRVEGDEPTEREVLQHLVGQDDCPRTRTQGTVPENGKRQVQAHPNQNSRRHNERVLSRVRRRDQTAARLVQNLT